MANRKPPKMSERQSLCNLAVVLAFLMLSFALTYSSLYVQPWDNLEAWRQSDTYSIMMNYIKNGIDIFRPQVNYDGAGPNIIQLELQILPALGVITCNLYNKVTPAVPRLISLMFFYGSAIFVYLIGKKLMHTLSAFTAMFVYMFLPITMSFSRAIMPETCALFFLCGGIFFLADWFLCEQTDEKCPFWLSAVFFAFAIMEKLPIMFIGVLILAVMAMKYQYSMFRKLHVYAYAAVTLLPSAIYYAIVARFSEFKMVNNLAVKHAFTWEIFSLLAPSSAEFFKESLPGSFGNLVILIAIAGFICTFKKEKSRLFLLFLAASFILECTTIVAMIKLQYYLIFIAPTIALLCGTAVDELFRLGRTQSFGLVFVVCIVTFALGNATLKRTAKTNEYISKLGSFIAENTETSAVIAVDRTCTDIFAAADRNGYRANIKYYEYIPQEPIQEVQYFIEHGVDYFVLTGETTKADERYRKHLSDNFMVHTASSECVIYDLRKKR